MKRPVPCAVARSSVLVLVVLAVATLGPAHPDAQSGTAAPAASTVPRAADGHPDLTGVYQGGSTRVGGWQEANPANAGRGAGAAAGAAAGAPAAAPARRPGPAYQPWALDLLDQQFRRRNIDSSAALCMPNPTYLTTGLFPVEFIQTPKKIVILLEYMGLFRNIPLDVPHPDDHVPTYLGTSVGHWDGDTLVVDSIDFHEQLNAGGGGGRMHSDALHMVERFTRTDLNTIKYHVDWDDPKVLTRPDTIDSQFMLRADTRIREYVCNENNEEPANFEKLKKTDLFLRK